MEPEKLSSLVSYFLTKSMITTNRRYDKTQVIPVERIHEENDSLWTF